MLTIWLVNWFGSFEKKNRSAEQPSTLRTNSGIITKTYRVSTEGRQITWNFFNAINQSMAKAHFILLKLVAILLQIHRGPYCVKYSPIRLERWWANWRNVWVGNCAPGSRSRSKTAQDMGGLSGFPARFERFEQFSQDLSGLGVFFWKNRSNRSNLA